jgi:YD repeat-containing protein
MRVRFFTLIVIFQAVFTAKSQYYYKDIVLTRQNQQNWKIFHDLKVKQADIKSLDANNEPTDGFSCIQTISGDFSTITTYTKSANTPASTMITYYDRNGRMIRTTDTSDTFKSTTEYTYNDNGQVTSLLNNSVQTDNQVGATEKHLWLYEGNQLKKMIKIKGETDTTIVNLIKDEKGNIIEEKSVREGQSLPSIYYYYDNEGRLTDIVRYNQKAGRLLPDYVFEYFSDRISSMIFVPAGSSDYQKWIYQYAENGLKINETCYDKKKQLVVKINYEYSFMK